MEERVREMEKLRRLKTYRQNPDILLRLPDGGPPAPVTPPLPPAPVTPPSSRPPLELKFRKTKFPTEVYQLAHDYVQESSKKLKKEIRSRACDLVKAARTDCSPRFFTYLNFAVRKKKEEDEIEKRHEKLKQEDKNISQDLQQSYERVLKRKKRRQEWGREDNKKRSKALLSDKQGSTLSFDEQRRVRNVRKFQARHAKEIYMARENRRLKLPLTPHQKRLLEVAKESQKSFLNVMRSGKIKETTGQPLTPREQLNRDTRRTYNGSPSFKETQHTYKEKKAKQGQERFFSNDPCEAPKEPFVESLRKLDLTKFKLEENNNVLASFSAPAPVFCDTAWRKSNQKVYCICAFRPDLDRWIRLSHNTSKPPQQRWRVIEWVKGEWKPSLDEMQKSVHVLCSATEAKKVLSNFFRNTTFVQYGSCDASHISAWGKENEEEDQNLAVNIFEGVRGFADVYNELTKGIFTKRPNAPIRSLMATLWYITNNLFVLNGNANSRSHTAGPPLIEVFSLDTVKESDEVLDVQRLFTLWTILKQKFHNV